MRQEKLDQTTTKTIWQNPFVRKALLFIIALVAVFLLGFIPTWQTANERAKELTQKQFELKRANLENTLASAALNARRAAYEPARQQASDFFTVFREEAERDSDSSFSAAQKDAAKPLLAQRDEIITLLARNDPAAADRLAEMFFSFQQVINSSPVVKTQ